MIVVYVLSDVAEGIECFARGECDELRWIDAAVPLGESQNLLVWEHEAVGPIRADRMRDGSFPYEATKIASRVPAVLVFLRRPHLGDPARSYQHAPGIVSEWGAFRVEEYERFLRLQGAEEGVQHDLLILEVVEEVGREVEFGFSIDVEGEHQRIGNLLGIVLSRPAERDRLHAVGR